MLRVACAAAGRAAEEAFTRIAPRLARTVANDLKIRTDAPKRFASTNLSDFNPPDISLRQPEYAHLSQIEKAFKRRELLAEHYKLDPKLFEFDTLRTLVLAKNVSTNPTLLAAIDEHLNVKEEILNVSENGIATSGQKTVFACTNFLIELEDGTVRNPILCGETEEPSVAAGSNGAAKMICSTGPIKTSALPTSTMFAQIFLQHPSRNPSEDEIQTAIDQINDPNNQKALIEKLINTVPKLKSQTARTGGIQGEFKVNRIIDGKETRLEVLIPIEMGDMQGANLANLTAEPGKDMIGQLIGWRGYVGILSNVAYKLRGASATCTVDPKHLASKAFPDGDQFAQDIHTLDRDSKLSLFRSTTQSKGVYNAIEAFCAAANQDTRAVMAALYDQQAKMARETNSPTPLMPPVSWRLKEDGLLHGSCTLHMHPSTVGIVRTGRQSGALFQIMGIDSTATFTQYCAALGLALSLASARSIVAGGNTKHHLKFTPNHG